MVEEDVGDDEADGDFFYEREAWIFGAESLAEETGIGVAGGIEGDEVAVEDCASFAKESREIG